MFLFNFLRQEQFKFSFMAANESINHPIRMIYLALVVRIQNTHTHIQTEADCMQYK